MQRAPLMFSTLALVGAALLAGCSDDLSAPSSAAAGSEPQALATTSPSADAVASIRLRCERRSTRSRISVDARGLSARAGQFRARVTASGGTVTSRLQRAVGGEDEFDFDSNPNDIRAGATRIAVSFISARPGADVVAKVLNAAGQVVATASGDCEIR